MQRKLLAGLLALFIITTFFAPAALAADPGQLPPGTYGNIIIGADGRLVPSAYDDIQTFETGKTPDTILYVAPDGKDSNDGSEAKPLRSIAKAVEKAQPGTAIRLKPGEYTPGGSLIAFIENLRGTADKPIWIGGMPGEARPVLKGGNEAIHVVRGSYLVFHDMEITGAKGNGFNFDDGGDFNDMNAASNIVFRGIYIHNIGSGGNQDNFKFSGLNNYYVYDCEASFGGTGDSSGIDQVGCHNALITRNYFHDQGGNAFQFKGGSFDAVITQNLLVECGERAVIMGGTTDLELFRPSLSATAVNHEAVNIYTYSNVIIGTLAPFAFVSARNCYAINNTVISPGYFLFRILQEGGVDGACRGNTVANNIFYYGNEVQEHINIGRNTEPETFVVKNNLFYNYDAPSSRFEIPDMMNFENSIFGVNPGFLSVQNNNLQLSGKSPAIGQGVGYEKVAIDFVGLPFAASLSLGAYEYIAVGDVNGDNAVNIHDIALWVKASGMKKDDSAFMVACDLNFDGVIDDKDLNIILENL